MKDLNYLLIEAMEFKMSGYTRLSASYYSKLAHCIYEGLSGKGLVNIISRMVNRSKSFGFIDVATLNVENIVYTYDVANNLSLGNEKNYLATAETSGFVKKIYSRIYLDDSYRELAFSMFILSMVSPSDYLRHETDINWLLGRFKFNNTKLGSEDGVYIRGRNHLAILACYLCNASNGEDYGVNPYDFVYYMLKTATDIPGILQANNLRFGCCDVFSFSDETIKKYKEEILVILPMLINAGNIKKESIEKLLYKSGDTVCEQFVEMNINSLIGYWDEQCQVVEFERKCVLCS